MHLVTKTVMNDEGVELSGAPAKETTKFPLSKVSHWLLIIFRSLLSLLLCLFANSWLSKTVSEFVAPIDLAGLEHEAFFLLLSPKSSLFFCITADENGNSPEIFLQILRENSLGGDGLLKGSGDYVMAISQSFY